jgi:hypothetical protein
MTRPCGCPADANNHTDPEPDWIGDTPIMHGESERPVPGSSHMLYGYPSLPDMFCLCGHPFHMSCPAYLGIDGWGDGVMDLELHAAGDDSRPAATRKERSA